MSGSEAGAAKYSLGQRLLLAVVPALAASFIRLISVTLRFESIAPAGFTQPPPPGTGIYCFWHQCVLPCTWYFRNYRCFIVISRSFDGELVARTAAKFGYTAVRGSSSRGGVQALMALRAVIDQGLPLIFTADGPRGPIYKAKPGPIKLAQISGQPVGSFHLLPEHAWQINSWDRFLIPRPFSRVVVSWGTPVLVAADSTDAELEARRLELQNAMEEARHRAERFFGREPKIIGDNI